MPASANMQTIGLGGSCHWCTEAIFLSLNGVTEVKQGWISAGVIDAQYSEAILVTFNTGVISLAQIIEIHLYTHSCTSNHAMRKKYRSAIYCFNESQAIQSEEIINSLQQGFEKRIITQVLKMDTFKLNKSEYLNYYYEDPSKGFCRNIINPKLKMLLEKFALVVDKEKIGNI